MSDRQQPIKPTMDQVSSQDDLTAGKRGDPYRLALQDLKRKRAEIDAAMEAIYALRPDLRLQTS